MTIRLEKVTKLFPGVAKPAVDALDLTIESGQVCVLIGPSGCGKTTTMRMVNRLIEPTSGPSPRPIRSSCVAISAMSSSRSGCSLI